jgi:hypothetical protein
VICIENLCFKRCEGHGASQLFREQEAALSFSSGQLAQGLHQAHLPGLQASQAWPGEARFASHFKLVLVQEFDGSCFPLPFVHEM